jgi:histidyl-tRNA synthetase
MAADAELVEFTSRFFENLNLENITIDISHRKLVESYITNVFQSEDPKLVSEAFRAMDKIQKKRKDDILKEYQEKGIDKEKLEKILEFSEIKGTPHEIEQSFDVSGLKDWEELKELYFSLEERDVKNIRINFGIVRGLDYYSGFVFEAFDSSSDIGALVGGGRYDTLPKAFGRNDLGATGVAGGVERIIFSLDKQQVIPPTRVQTISVLYATAEMQEEASNLASELRSNGIPIEIDLVGRPLKKQFESATSSKYAIIVGSKEFSDNKVVLRNMQDRTEKQISIDELLAHSKSILS